MWKGEVIKGDLEDKNGSCLSTEEGVYYQYFIGNKKGTKL